MSDKDPTPAKTPREPSQFQPTFREIAREEFWFVAKGFFAPVYGTYLVWRQLLRQTDRADSKALGVPAPQRPPSQPAE